MGAGEYRNSPPGVIRVRRGRTAPVVHRVGEDEEFNVPVAVEHVAPTSVPVPSFGDFSHFPKCQRGGHADANVQVGDRKDTQPDAPATLLWKIDDGDGNRPPASRWRV